MLQILLVNQEVSAAEVDFLLRSPWQTGATSPVEFLSHQAWGGIKVSTIRWGRSPLLPPQGVFLTRVPRKQQSLSGAHQELC